MYRVYRGSRNDPKDYRVFVIVSRQVLINSKFSTLTCAPVYSTYDGISTQVQIGVPEGMKHDSAIHCDELVSIPKAALTDYVGSLSPSKILELKKALSVALEIENQPGLA